MVSPSRFFKFVSADRVDILREGFIRFSPIGDFNDPFELQPVITPYSQGFLEHCGTLTPDELNKMKFSQEDYKYSDERERKINAYKEKYKNEIGKFGVLCLSSNNQINPILTVSTPDKADPRSNILM